MAALLASALAGVLVAATLGGRYALAAAVGLVQVLLLGGIVLASDVPARRSSALVALVAGLAAAGFVVARGETATVAEPSADADVVLASLTPLLVAVGAGFVAMAVVQLARRDGRDRLTASLTLGVTALLLAVTPAVWLGIADDDVGTALLLLALAGTATGAAIAAFPGPLLLWAIGGAVAGGGVGLLLQAYAEPVADSGLHPFVTALAAGACGLAAVAGLWVVRLARGDRERAGHPLGGAPNALLTSALPLVVAAPVAFGVAWAIAEGVLA